jgi:hypothetical protein
VVNLACRKAKELAPSRPPCARARTGGGAPLPRHAGTTR